MCLGQKTKMTQPNLHLQRGNHSLCLKHPNIGIWWKNFQYPKDDLNKKV